jgi:hypothetical protein
VKISLRARAKAAGLKRYFTGKPCKYGHIAERLTRTGFCAVCYKLWTKANYLKNAEILRAAARKSTLRRYHAKKDDPAYRQILKNRARLYRERYPEKQAAFCRERQAAKLFRSPVWVSKDEKREIQGLYLASSLLSEMHGVRLHVDHVIPLRSKIASGLHVLKNLQLLPADENHRKSNHFEDI